MTSRAEKYRIHVMIIAVVFGIGVSLAVVNYLRLNLSTTEIAFKDATGEKLLSVHPLNNGLVELSFVNNKPIVIRTNESKTPPAVIGSNIGYSAVTLSD